MYFLYSLIICASLFLLAPYFLVQGLRRGKNLRNLPERLGLRFPPELASSAQVHASAPGCVWLHAVSVGEVLAAVPLARSLKASYPERRLVVSTTTETGQALARERMKFADAVLYFPLDLPGAMRRTMNVIQPGLIVVMETEIWPNFLRTAREAGVPVAYANGRISDRSFKGFRRWLPPGFRKRIFAEGALYLMQGHEDARRVMELGSPAERVVVTGNLKYDLQPPAENALVNWLRIEMKRSLRGPLLVAGSVITGEESFVLEAMTLVAARWPDALLVFAPRRPERFREVAEMMERAGCKVVRRSALSLGGDDESAGVLRQESGGGTVLLLDSLGELAPLYRLADAVFIGGSLVPSGGHNPLEPAAFGVAPVFGPSMENFRDIAGEFLAGGAALQVNSGADLGAAWIALFEDDRRRSDMGKKACELVERHRGATAATLDQLGRLLQTPQAVR